MTKTDKKQGERLSFFFDFDNTITTRDVLDNMLIRFSADDRWLDLEHKWKRGDIGSMECLKGQLESIRITKSGLNKYLSTVRIDPHFKPLVKFLASRDIGAVILSDNFDYILDRILKNNKISGLAVYSNRLRIERDRLIPSFPHMDKRCGNCGHCKKTTLSKNKTRGTMTAYVGDGRSDICVSEDVDLVFAKGYLREYRKAKRLSYVPFDTLKDIHKYLERSLS